MAAPLQLVGQTLSHYRIIEQIGAGGMGVVYRARDEQLQRDVAIKVLPIGTLADESARKRFRKEALALAKLNHPNIATIFEFSSQNSTDYLVTEYISGLSLDNKLAAGALSEKEVMGLGIQLAQGLGAAHEQGIVHRDLKPANLRLTSDGRLKILDFGLAHLMPHPSEVGMTATLTHSQEVIGTLPYMAPEQLRGEPAEARTDVWAAGAVLYEMATGHRPFEETLPTALAGDIIHKAPPTPRSVKSELSRKLEAVILKCLEKEKAKRYQSARELQSELERLGTGVTPAAARRPLWPIIATGAIAVVMLAGVAFFYLRWSPKLTDKDTIVLADFTNTTGDTVFDDTLKQALAVDLGQSPFMNILSEEKVRQTLRQMTRSPSERLTQDLAREVCQRAGSTAYLAGSIAALGTQYVIGLETLNCASGDVLAREQVTAAGKEQVLPALSQATGKLRNELGESLSSMQKFDVPLEQATTNSLEALKAYTLGLKTQREKGDAEALPFDKRAIELDPNFALAYDALGVNYSNLNEPRLAADYLNKAFDLRDRVTEREKFHITALYYDIATGELEKANQTYDLWMHVYPRDSVAHGYRGSDYMVLGQYERAASETREALRLEPNAAFEYENLAEIYLALNRFDEARTTTEEALGRNLEDIPLHLNLYALAFIQGNVAAMKQQDGWAVGKSGAEDQMLSLESDTEAWSGRLGKARELSRQAVESARRSDEREPAALWQADAAIREALFGNADAARKNAAAAVALAPGSNNAEAQAALAYALAGDAAHAQSLADDLAKRFPQNTVVHSVWLPTIRAQIETGRKDPARSVELLQEAAPYELGMLTGSAVNSCLYPVYVRAEAQLSAQQGPAAAAEFQKILDHRGLLWNCATGALEHLGLARAYALQARSTQGADADAARVKARAAFQDFLTLWKDADPDIPILKQAKAEYAKLK